MMRSRLLVAFAAIASLTLSTQAAAQVVTYNGLDVGASAPSTNALASQSAFILSTGGSVVIDWESPLPAGVSYAGGVTAVTNSSSCALPLCGGNTTAAGAYFLAMNGSSTTFTFLSAINYFGAFFGGVQLSGIDIAFNNGSAQSVAIASGANVSSGGFAFAGFTSVQSFTSFTINAGADIISVDDVLYGTSSTVPEPATMTLLATGLAGMAASRRKKRRG